MVALLLTIKAFCMLTYRYNPQNATAEELRATFIAREEMLEQTLTDLRERSKSKTNQHFLVIGPRGIGKTNFLMMVYFGVRNDKDLSSQFLPLKFSEEEYSIVSLRDLFEQALEVLVEETQQAELQGYLEKVREEVNDEKAAEKAIQHLKDFARKEGKIILLLVDNIDLILGKQIKKQAEIKRLRDILMNQSFLTIIGAAPTYFQEVSGYSKPLYNLFKVLNLAELNEVQMQNFIRKRAEYDENKELLERLPGESHKLKALHHLTGGNPRMVLTLYQILALAEFSDVKEYLVRLLDDLSPYFKGKLEWLSPQQRKIVDSMAKMDGAVSPTEIAKRARLGINVVNTNLKRLLDWGYVKLAEQERRKTRYYIISERIFRIWHQMRYSRSSSRKIRFFVDFLQIWYTLEDLKVEAERLKKTFQHCLEEKDVIKAKGVIEHLDYISAASTESAFRDAISDAEIQMLFDLDDLAGVQKRLEERIKCYSEARNVQGLAKALHGMGLLHAEMGEYEKAVEYFDKEVEIRPDDNEAWVNRADVLDELERHEEAMKSYDEALRIEPDDDRAWYNRGNVLARLERYEEAINSYDKALRINPDKHEAWGNRGNALTALTRYEEAMKSYDEVLRIKPDDHLAWYNRGNALARLERYEEAIKSYDEALKIKPDDHEAWNNRGAALLDSERSEEAVDSFQKALEHSTVKSDLEMCTLVLVRAYLILSRRNISEGNDAAGLHAFSSAIGHLYEVGAEPIRKDAASAIVDYFRKIVSKMRVGLFKDLIGILSNSGAKDELMLLEPFIIANNFWETGEDSEVLDRLNPEMREIVEEIIRKAGERDRNLNAKPGR